MMSLSNSLIMNRKYLLGLMVLSLSIAVFTTCKKNKDIDIDSFKIENQKVDSITANSVYISGFYTYTGDTEIGIKVKIWNEGNVFDSTYVMELDETNFSKHIGGLKTSTEYCYRYIVVFGTNNEHEIDSIFEFKIHSVRVSASDGGLAYIGDTRDTLVYFNKGESCRVHARDNVGYQFDKWVKQNGDVFSCQSDTTFTVDDNYTLVAHFTQLQTYTIHYDLKGGELSSGESNPSFYDEETPTFRLNNPTKTGYIFTGWTGTDLTEVTPIVTIHQGSIGNREYTANWAPITYTVYFYKNNEGASGTMNDQLFTYDQAQTLTANAFTCTGYGFDEWNTQANGNGTTYTDGQRVNNLTTEDEGVVNLYAQWTPITYTITVVAVPQEGGSTYINNPETTAQQCQFGTEIRINAQENLGYKFERWTKQNGDVFSYQADTTFTVDDDYTLAANFDHAYVDLGLPSGLLWATCNMGANTPDDYGDYFAWGEIAPKPTYTNENYNYSDNHSILPPDHDAATVNWGGSWRMPTQEEFQELLDNTTSQWTSQNGMNGMLFTSTTNSNSIFLPAAGDGNNLISAGKIGSYWSSFLSLDNQFYAKRLYFSFGPTTSLQNDIYRYYGLTVRPVRFLRKK